MFLADKNIFSLRKIKVGLVSSLIGSAFLFPIVGLTETIENNSKEINTYINTSINDDKVSDITQKTIDEVFKSSNTYAKLSKFSIDESQYLPSDKIIIDTNTLYSSGYDRFPNEWTEETRSLRDKTLDSMATMWGGGKVVGTVNSQNIYRDSTILGKLGLDYIMQSQTRQIHNLLKSNFLTENEFVTDIVSALHSRAVTSPYLYADAKAAFLRLEENYKYAKENNLINDNLERIYREGKSYYEAYTRKYNLWMGFDYPVTYHYVDSTENHPRMEEIKNRVDNLINRLPKYYSQYLGSVVFYKKSDGLLGYSYSNDQRINLNMEYLVNMDDRNILGLIVHEVGHIIDGNSFYQNKGEELQSFSRSSEFKEVYDKWFSYHIAEEFSNALAQYYERKLGFDSPEKNIEKNNDIDNYVENHIIPNLYINNINKYNIHNYKYIGATNEEELRALHKSYFETREEFEDIEYNVVNKTDNNMYEDEVKTIPGELGQKKYTHNIYFEEGNELSRKTKEEIIKNPVDEIVITGTKPVFTSKINNYTTTIPISVIYKEDSNLPKGETRFEEGTVGYKKVQITNYYNKEILEHSDRVDTITQEMKPKIIYQGTKITTTENSTSINKNETSSNIKDSGIVGDIKKENNTLTFKTKNYNSALSLLDFIKKTVASGNYSGIDNLYNLLNK